MIKDIINSFNQALSTDKGIIRGLATPTIILDDDEKIIPMIYEAEEYPFVDDDYSFGLYHKLNGNTYTNEQNAGFGNNAKITCTSDISIIGWGFNNQLTAHDFEQWVIKNAPETCRIYSTSFDKKQIFTSEFTKIDDFINEDIFLVKINYKVIYKVDKNCIETTFNF